MEVFKYRANFERDLLALLSNQIYAPTMAKLNDPFEGLLDSTWDEKTIGDNEKQTSNNLRLMYENILESLKSSGIYSLSKDFKNEILWSLYADGHTGFVIGYDVNRLLGSINCSNIYPIVHKESIQYLNNPKGLLQWRDQPYNGFNMSNGLGIKSKSWEHEDEVRLIFEQNGFFEYHFSSISRIIFGLRTSAEKIKQTMFLLRGRNFKYEQIKLSENKFILDVRDLVDLYPTEILYKQNWAKFDETLITEERLKCNDLNIIDKIKIKVNEIRQMPKILKIVAVSLEQNTDFVQLSITCICDYEQLPARILLYELSFDEFIRIPLNNK